MPPGILTEEYDIKKDRTLRLHGNFEAKSWTRFSILKKFGHPGMRGIHLFAGKGELVEAHLRAGASKVLCIDKDAGALAACRSRYGTKVQTMTADVFRLLKESKLDRVDFVDMDPFGTCAKPVALWCATQPHIPLIWLLTDTGRLPARLGTGPHNGGVIREYREYLGVGRTDKNWNYRMYPILLVRFLRACFKKRGYATKTFAPASKNNACYIGVKLTKI